MKRLIVFILLFPFNSVAQDALLQAIYGNWYNSNKYENSDKIESVSEVESDPFYSDEAEVYHWELGTRDDIPEIEIIYEDPNPCQL
jgi:hypothetical protein